MHRAWRLYALGARLSACNDAPGSAGLRGARRRSWAQEAKEGEALGAGGLPAANAPGLQVAPWLRFGSLRPRRSQAASHALMPALRRRWRWAG